MRRKREDRARERYKQICRERERKIDRQRKRHEARRYSSCIKSRFSYLENALTKHAKSVLAFCNIYIVIVLSNVLILYKQLLSLEVNNLAKNDLYPLLQVRTRSDDIIHAYCVVLISFIQACTSFYNRDRENVPIDPMEQISLSCWEPLSSYQLNNNCLTPPPPP